MAQSFCAYISLKIAFMVMFLVSFCLSHDYHAVALTCGQSVILALLLLGDLLHTQANISAQKFIHSPYNILNMV